MSMATLSIGTASIRFQKSRINVAIAAPSTTRGSRLAPATYTGVRGSDSRFRYAFGTPLSGTGHLLRRESTDRVAVNGNGSPDRSCPAIRHRVRFHPL